MIAGYRYLLIVMCILTTTLSLNSTTVKGVAKDTSNNKPLEAVNIYLEGTKYGGATSSNGYYTIPDVPAGNYRIVFSMIGYKVIKKEISVGEGDVLTFNYQSVPQVSVTNIFHVGNGDPYDIDMLLKKRVGQISGWFAYSASKARVTFNDINYPPFYDRNHNLNFIGEVTLWKNIAFSSKFTYGSGTPYTPIIGWYPYYYIDPRTGEIKKGLKVMRRPKNSARFPDYHRLDIGAVRKFKYRDLNLSLRLSVINVYNHKSVLLHFYDPRHFPPIPVEIYTIPIVPSLELHITFP